MAFDNFTVNVVSFNETEGVDWTQNRPSVTLIITPNAGYAINVANFSPITPLPTYVDSVTFSQSGTNIECVILYTSPSVMPSNDVLIALCINGSATEIAYSVSGDVLGIQAGCNISNTIPTAYANQGNFNETKAVLYLTVRADTGYYFPVQPTLVLSVGSTSNYVISKTNILDGSGNITETNFVVQYTFPNFSVTGNHLTLSACAAEIYVPVTGISSYSMNTSLVGVGGETRTMTVYGSSGSVFTVAMDGVDLVTNITMSSTGSYSFPVVFPAVTTDTTYSILLSGDLVSPFAQTNPFTIQQKVNTEITLSVLFPSGITVQNSVVKSYFPFGEPPVGDAAEVINFGWNITPTSPSLLSLSRQPVIGDWSNLNPLLNGGSSIFPTAAISLQDPATGGTIAVGGNIDRYGGTNMETVLDLTNIIVVQPYTELTLCYAVTETALCCGNSISVTVFVLEDVANLDSVTGDLYTDNTFQTKAADGYYSDDAGITCSTP